MRHKDGRYRVTDGRARVLDGGRIVTVVNDVTAEHAMSENAEQLRFATNAVPALIALSTPTLAMSGATRATAAGTATRPSGSAAAT